MHNYCSHLFDADAFIIKNSSAFLGCCEFLWNCLLSIERRFARCILAADDSSLVARAKRVSAERVLLFSVCQLGGIGFLQRKKMDSVKIRKKDKFGLVNI